MRSIVGNIKQAFILYVTTWPIPFGAFRVLLCKRKEVHILLLPVLTFCMWSVKNEYWWKEQRYFPSQIMPYDVILLTFQISSELNLFSTCYCTICILYLYNLVVEKVEKIKEKDHTGLCLFRPIEFIFHPAWNKFKQEMSF